jgi:hypothetical protein
MKKLSFFLIILSLTIIFGACPSLEEDNEKEPDKDEEKIKAITFDKPFELDVYKWFEILDGIAKDGKYVSLDLSKGTYVEGNEKNGGGGLSKVEIDGIEYIAFDPFPASSSGKNYIYSITLPLQAQIIKYAEPDSAKLVSINDKGIEDTKKLSAFRSFTTLLSVKAENVTLIGNFAFADCKLLKEVVFPKVGHTVLEKELKDDENLPENGYCRDIGEYAFLGCAGLKEISFNSAAVIGEYAFKDCTSLSSVKFPEVWMIENNAFEGCNSLENIFFEKASKIGKEAFKNCTGLKKAEFNVQPNRLFDPIESGDFFPVAPVDKIVYDSVIFYPSVFTGCKALEVLNVRRAWNVYFSKDVFAYTGAAIEIYMFDEKAGDGDCVGHPQKESLLGEDAAITLKEVNIYIPLSVSVGQVKNTMADSIISMDAYKNKHIDVNVNQRNY